jgi:hypothetical protein
LQNWCLQFEETLDSREEILRAHIWWPENTSRLGAWICSFFIISSSHKILIRKMSLWVIFLLVRSWYYICLSIVHLVDVVITVSVLRTVC